MKIDLETKICYYSSEEELNFNVHKLIHTFDVADMVQSLIKVTKPALSKKLQQQILNAAILHDIGRCYEFKKGKKVDIDHGKIGADLIKKRFPKMMVESQSTFFHNKLPSDRDPKSCQPVLDYVRDADMLANMRYEIENTDIFLIHIWGNKKKAFLTPKIDPEILNAVKERRSPYISKIKVQNLLTMWLWQLCWVYNLKTTAGKKIAKKEKIFTRFRDLICQKIIPMITQDKAMQKSLILKINQTFPDKMFS